MSTSFPALKAKIIQKPLLGFERKFSSGDANKEMLRLINQIEALKLPDQLIRKAARVSIYLFDCLDGISGEAALGIDNMQYGLASVDGGYFIYCGCRKKHESSKSFNATVASINAADLDSIRQTLYTANTGAKGSAYHLAFTALGEIRLHSGQPIMGQYEESSKLMEFIIEITPH